MIKMLAIKVRISLLRSLVSAVTPYIRQRAEEYVLELYKEAKVTPNEADDIFVLALLSLLDIER